MLKAYPVPWSRSSGWRSGVAYVVGHFVPTAAVLAPAAGLQLAALKQAGP